RDLLLDDIPLAEQSAVFEGAPAEFSQNRFAGMVLRLFPGRIAERVLDAIAFREALAQPCGAESVGECPEAAAHRDHFGDPRAEHEGLNELVLDAPLQMERLVEAERAEQLPHQQRA